MTFNFYLNIGLWLIIFFSILVYLFIKAYYTKMYQQFQTPIINSSNDVISNSDLNEIIVTYKKLFGLENYIIIYDKEIKFKNFGLGFNKHKKEIYISKLIFTSVGYEIDYIISRLWYAKQSINKNSQTKMYSFFLNYMPVINGILLVLLFSFQTIIFGIGTAQGNGEEIKNSVIEFLWNYPLIFFINFLLIINAIIDQYILNKLKEYIEIEYTKDVLLKFQELFISYGFDLRTARMLSQKHQYAYNLSFKIGIDETNQIKWIGPFSNY